MSSWEMLDAIAAEIGSLTVENNRFRREIDLLREEVELLKDRAADADTNFEAIK
ncbi:hypothetical protein NDI52_28485 [Leptolyngbya sp. PL-A3]